MSVHTSTHTSIPVAKTCVFAVDPNAFHLPIVYSASHKTVLAACATAVCWNDLMQRCNVLQHTWWYRGGREVRSVKLCSSRANRFLNSQVFMWVKASSPTPCSWTSFPSGRGHDFMFRNIKPPQHIPGIQTHRLSLSSSDTTFSGKKIKNLQNQNTKKLKCTCL